MSKPTVSVVLPTRNRRLLLGRALRTVLGQRDVALEAIVVDDGSTDATPASSEDLADPRVRLLRREVSGGPAAARNAGLEAASAPWTAFLDDDDVWAPNKLSSQLVALEETPGAEWACAGAIVLDAGLCPTARQRVADPAEIPHRLRSYNVVPGGCSGVIARTEVVRASGGFATSLSVLADWDLWLRLAGESAPAYVDRPLVGYVLHGKNMTSRAVGFRAELVELSARHPGLEIDEEAWARWLLDMERRGGARVGPALGYARLAVARRRPEHALRALGVAFRPGWVARLDSKRREVLDPAWREEAETWLANVREAKIT